MTQGIVVRREAVLMRVLGAKRSVRPASEEKSKAGTIVGALQHRAPKSARAYRAEGLLAEDKRPGAIALDGRHKSVWDQDEPLQAIEAAAARIGKEVLDVRVAA